MQSTKPKPIKKEEELDSFLAPDKLNVKVNNICYTIVSPTEVIVGYIDLTGLFLKRSLRNNQYVMVGYHYNVNYMRGIPIKNRK